MQGSELICGLRLRLLVTMSSDPVLDPESIAALNAVSPDDGGAFLRELIDIFLTDTPPHLAEIKAGIAQADAPKVARAAHSLKGAAGNFGALSLARIAQQLETNGKAGELSGAPGLLPKLEAEFARVKVAMEALRAG